jgi:hypothetical protein
MPSSSNIRIEPAATDVILSNDHNDASDLQKTEVHQERFINFNEMGNDLKKFSDIFNSYATKKTFATGFFNLALVGKF